MSKGRLVAEAATHYQQKHLSAPSGRAIPQDIDAERAVLGAMILSPETTEEVLSVVDETAFYRPAHRKIFRAIKDLAERNVAADQVSLADRLKTNGELEEIGGRAYILELGNNAFALSNWAHHVEIVKRKAMLRNLITASTQITALGYDAPDDLDEVVEQAERLIYDVTNKRVGNNFKPITELLTASFNELERMAEMKDHMIGVPTGFIDLDKIFSGLRGGDLIILAARPAVGKTSFALNLATNAAKKGTKVLFFTLEMAAEQLVQRILCTEARIDLQAVRSGQLQPEHWNNIVDSMGVLSQLDISVDETSDMNILELRAKARRMLRNCDKGLIVVDYLQLMQASKRNPENRNIEVSEISRGLKILAKELNVPVVALSQLSRTVEARKGKRPMLSDLRESGSIEQDADIVMFLDRSMDEREANDPDRPPLGQAEVIIAKHRNGPTGSVKLAFTSRFTRFDNFTSREY